MPGRLGEVGRGAGRIMINFWDDNVMLSLLSVAVLGGAFLFLWPLRAFKSREPATGLKPI
jgi:hypothetical protein